MVEASGLTTFSYQRGKVVFADSNTLCTATGNGLVLYSTFRNQQRHVWGGAGKQGGSEGPYTVGAAPAGGLLAYGPRDCPGSVTIAHSPKFAPAKTIEFNAELGYLDLAVSRCKSHLAILTGPPEKKLFLMDISTDPETLLAERKLGRTLTGHGASFFPGTPNVFVSFGARKAVILQLERTTSTPTVRTAEVAFSSMDDDEYVTGHAWTEARELYIGSSHGNLFRVAGAAPEPGPAPKWGSGRAPPLAAEALALLSTAVIGGSVRVAGLAVTRRHLIAAYAKADGNSVLVWHSRKAEESGGAPSLLISHACDLEDAEVCWLAPDPHLQKFALGSVTGAIFVVEAVPDESVGPGAPGLKTSVIKHADFFSGPITGMAALSKSRIAACSDDGSVRMWRTQNVDGDILSDIVAVWYLGEAAAGCAGSHDSPLIAVGTEGGVVQVLDADLAVLMPQKQPGTDEDSDPEGAEESPGSGGPAASLSGKQEQAPLAFSCRVHSAPVLALAVSPGADRLASLAQDSSLTVMETTRRPTKTSTGWEVEVSCFTEVPKASGALAWAPPHPSRPEMRRLVVAVGAGDIVLLMPPARRDVKRTSKDLWVPPAAMPSQVVRTQSPLVCLSAAPSEGGAAGDTWVYAATADKSVRRFRVTAASFEQRRSTASYTLPEVDKGQECLMNPTSMAISQDAKMLLLTACDGSLSAYSLPHLTLEGRWPLHDAAQAVGGATSCALVPAPGLDSQIAATGGGDAAVHLLELGPGPVNLRASGTGELSGPGGTQGVPSGNWTPGRTAEPARELFTNASEAESFVADVQRRQREIASEKSEGEHAKTRREIQQLRESFEACITENEMAAESERVPRQEFVIDRDLRRILLEEGEKRVGALKHALRMQIATEAIQHDRLRETCLSTVEEPYTHLFAFGTGGSFREGTGSMRQPPPPPQSLSHLANYPLRKVPAHEGRQLRVLRFLRSVELLEWERRPARDRGHVAIVGFQGAAEAGSEELADEESQESHQSGGGAAADDKLISEEHAALGRGPGNLLYRELALHCATRKRTHALLLENDIREQKKKFNEKFRALQAQKLDVIAKVEENHKRIEEILKELEVEGEKPFVLVLRPEEDPAGSLEVRDEEISAEKYIPPEEKARLDAEAAKHAAEMEAAGRDSAFQRGLHMMMHGTLERREDKRAMLKREPWMELPLTEMTKEQRQALKEFEKRAAELEEELYNQQRALEGERKSLEADVDKAILTFNESLAALLRERVVLDMKLLTDEYQIIRLAGSIEEIDYSRARSSEIGETISTLRLSLSGKQPLLTELQKLILRQRQTVDHLTAEDKQIDKAFRREFSVPELEEHFDMITKMYKDRKRAQQSEEPKRGSSLLSAKSQRLLQGTTTRSMRSAALRSPGPTTLSMLSAPDKTSESQEKLEEGLDPFANLHDWEVQDEVKPRTDLRNPFSVYDFPESINENLFWRLMDLRDAKIAVERELQSATNRLSRLLALMEAEHEEESSTKDRVNELLSEVAHIVEEVENLGINADMTFQLNMGQVELADRAVIPDLADAALMHRNQVDRLNSEVISRATGKVTQMRDINLAMRTCTFIQWENEAQDLLAEHKMQHISELQLLHVTREIQDFMTDPERALSYNREAQLQSQISVSEKAHKLKLALMKRRIGQLEEIAEEQSLENQYLRENTAKATMALEERERMNAALDTAEATPAKERARAFRNLVTNQRLKDISRSQMEELYFLHSELQRLHRRSFPKFAEGSFPNRPFTSPDVSGGMSGNARKNQHIRGRQGARPCTVSEKGKQKKTKLEDTF